MGVFTFVNHYSYKTRMSFIGYVNFTITVFLGESPKTRRIFKIENYCAGIEYPHPFLKPSFLP